MFLSAGFDSHVLDKVSHGFGKLLEYDYFLITKQIVKIAEAGKFPIISVLEGGYNVEGWELSPYANSISNHIRGLILKTSEPYDAKLHKRAPEDNGDNSLDSAPKKVKVESDDGELDISVDEEIR